MDTTNLQFIDLHGADPRQTTLAAKYAALRTSLDGIKTALAVMNDAHGRRVPESNRKHEQREFAFEVAFIKFERAISAATADGIALWADAEELRTLLKGIDEKEMTELDLLVAHNVACAFELANLQAATVHRIGMDQTHNRRYGIPHYYIHIERAFKARHEQDYAEAATELLALSTQNPAAPACLALATSCARLADLLNTATSRRLAWQEAQSGRIYAPQHALHSQRERAFNASVLAVRLLCSQVREALASASEAADTLAASIDGEYKTQGMRDNAIMRVDVVYATELCKRGQEVLDEMSRLCTPHEFGKNGFPSIIAALKARGEGTAERMFHTGRSCDPQPPAPFMTAEEAKEYADWFYSYSNGWDVPVVRAVLAD